MARAVPTNFGSSPLARGLHIFINCLEMMGRIIPARAGFTPLKMHSQNVSKDHPRSRGVYCHSTSEIS